MLTRREPSTVKIVLRASKKYKNNYPDSLDSVPFDWSVVGIFCGFLLAKWAQCTSDKMQLLVSTEGLPIAFIFPNSTFLGVDRTTVPQS